MRAPATPIRLTVLGALLATSCALELSRDLAAGEIQGRAVMLDADGAPVAAADTVVRVEGTPVVVKADARGRFKVRALPPGAYALKLEHASGIALRLRRVEQVHGLDLGDLVLGRLGALEGALSRGGTPVEGSVVLSGVREVPLRAGSVRIPDLPPGDVNLVVKEATGSLYDLGVVTVAPGATTNLTFDLAAMQPLESFGFSGTARYLDRTDHSGIRVIALGGMEGSVETSADGLYAEASVRAGVYTVRASAEGYADTVLSSVVVGGELAVPDLVLIPSGATCESGGLAVSDTDRDADGTPDADEPASCLCAPGTTDVDEDGLCDHVDDDLDNDGERNAEDNCPLEFNTDQADADDDGLGDACDPACFTESNHCEDRDGPCTAGRCDEMLQGCMTEQLPEGSSCDDGDACTTEDTCRDFDGELPAGCYGTPTWCEGDACNTGTCDAFTGLCGTEPTTGEVSCDDGSNCTYEDMCVEGACVGFAVDCSSAEDACATAACDEDSGECLRTARAGATTCDDGDACTSGDTCAGTQCSGDALDCSASDGICLVGACSVGGTGQPECTTFAAPDGTGCSDANPCTWGTSCASGGCGEPGTCRLVNVTVDDAAGVTTTSPYAGPDAAFTDGCGLRDLVVGFEASPAVEAGAPTLVALRARCAYVEVNEELGTYTVSLFPNGTSPFFETRGTSPAGQPSIVECPEGQAVTGVAARFDGDGGGLSSLAIDCATIEVVVDPARGPVLAPGTVTPDALTLGTPIGTAAFRHDCAAGAFATAQAGHADTVVTSYGLRCTRPASELAHVSPLAAGVLGGSENVADCGWGAGLVGLEGYASIQFYSGVLTQVRVHCANLVPGEFGDDDTFPVEVSEGPTLPDTGAYGASVVHDGVLRTTACGFDEVAIGITADASSGAQYGLMAGRVALHCAALTAKYVQGSFPFTTGAVTVTEAVGTGANGGTKTLMCPENTIATGLTVNSGDAVDGIRLRCGPLTVPAG